jgi:ceramide glucosyltransferase
MIFFFALSVLSAGLAAWQWFAARRFPLNQRSSNSSPVPAVSLLKPLKGADSQSAACLESWVRQIDGTSCQLLFGVASPDDPVCPIIRELISNYPKADCELIICGESLGANAKVSTLVQLERRAKFDLIVVSDADVEIPANFMPELLAPLRDPHVGLVHCLYRITSVHNFAMEWESVAVNADFWSQVLQSAMLKPVDFGLGATMAFRRSDFRQAGGFERLVDHLADDFQAGNRIFKLGRRLEFCRIAVACREAPMEWKAVWKHQLRWARTIRVCQPIPFFFSILSNATMWPMLLALTGRSPGACATAAACVVFRALTALDLRRRMEGSARVNTLWLALFKDVVGMAVWFLAFTGSTIEWRGRRFRVNGGGLLTEIS